MVANPLVELGRLGQSVWLDFIQKSLVESGELARLVAEDGLVGMTSNPAIFEKAIAGSSEYDAELRAAGKRCARDPKGVFEEIAIADVQRATDALKPVYERSARKDGYVSLEVSPKLAHDTQGTIDEARRLWKAVGRPNVMIKVPGTPEGVPAIRELIGAGINVNVTLLFSIEAYRAVAMAHLAGLEAFAQRGGDVTRVASVASFFVSRIDALVDKLLVEKAKTSGSEAERKLAAALASKTAIANAKLAYQLYLELAAAPRWKALAKRGAMPQRLLWASTSTKDPKLPDTLYVDQLIGADTVNTIPPATWKAFGDHGKVRVTLTADVAQARETLALLWHLGISLEKVTEQLLTEGLALFEQAFDKLLAAIAARAPGGAPKTIARMMASLPEALARDVAGTLAGWDAKEKVARLWKKDATLWTGKDEGQWLGWLDVVESQQKELAKFAAVAADVRAGGFTHVLLLGMGGSSLCPEVFAKTFGRTSGFPEFHVLDSTDPAQVASVEKSVDLARTLVIVASKSGSTLEPNIFKQHFFTRMQAAVGARAGQHFVAITDPGSKMQKVAEGDGFRKIHFGLPSIGGRYSALSDFGLVPAAVMGLDVAKLLARAGEMRTACAAGTKAAENPGVALGAVLGTAAKSGRDKLTLVTSDGVRHLGAWLEQLIAESTGKLGKAIVPVDLEHLAAPATYGNDRLFVHLKKAGDDAAAQEKALAALEDAGHPVVRIELRDAFDIAAEFFRWEIATAVAGEVLGIHPFDQPDVEASKVVTRQLSDAYEKTGSLPGETPLFAADGIELYTDDANAAELKKLAGATPTLAGFLRAHFGRLKPGDYVPLLAYVEMNAAHEATLQELRHALRDQFHVATCLGFGPRFLHSTGQAYKGGPNSAVVLQITCDDARDLPVPGQRYSFGVVKMAQARGDFAVLAERKRRALRVHLEGDVARGLETLRRALFESFGASGARATKRMAMVGLGRMGANMARRLMRAGHEIVGYARSKETVDALAREGALPAHSIAEAVAQLPRPRLVWVMVPAGDATESTVNELAKVLASGDVVVDGGNSYFKDDVRRAKELAKKGIHYVDAGTSGGVWGLERGYCLMVGGVPAAIRELEPILTTLAPGRGSIERTPGRAARRSSAEDGWLHCGPVGAGHFVKMIHNGIEYGIMQAYGEGFDVLKSAAKPEVPADWRYELDLADIAELWRRGSVVSSWLLDLTAIALAADPTLEGFSGFVQDSGEGRWTVQAAVEESVPAEVLTSSLYARFRSRQEHTFAEKLLSAMRKQFGGHVEPK
jgi:transaldolase/glucose-6-phosphate isomerase